MITMNSLTHILKVYLLCGVVALMLLSGASFAYAADGILLLQPETGIYSVGDTFTIDVVIDTDGEAINAGEGHLAFDVENVQVQEVDSTDSIFSSWTQMPAFSNEDGAVRFGGMASDEYLGEEGKVLSIIFEVIGTSQETIQFVTGAAISATDGLGTNIITEMKAGVYTLTPKHSIPQAEYVSPGGTPEALSITSATHSVEDAWSQITSATFNWEIASDVSAVRVLFSEHESSIPTIFYNEPLTSKTIDDIEDGVWFFHSQSQNTQGWSEVSTYTVNVDTVKPTNLTIKENARADLSNPNVSFTLSSDDELSGISHYEVKIDEGDWVVWSPEAQDTPYTPEGVRAGKHVLLVRVHDFAGNYIVDSVNFSIHFTDAPILTPFTETLVAGGSLTLQGKTLQNADVDVYWNHSDGREGKGTTVTGSQGGFTYTMAEDTEPGVYTLRVSAQSATGIVSKTSDNISVSVLEPPLASLGNKAISYMSIIVPLVGMIMILMLFVAKGMRKMRVYQGEVVQETGEAEEALHATFDALRDELFGYRVMLDKAASRRDLTLEENKLYKFLANNFEDVERSVEKEIHDITDVEQVVPPRGKKIRVTVID